jgi:hypothetical protein
MYTCWTSFSMTSLMKDNVNNEMFNENYQILTLSNRVLNWDEVLKLGDMLESDYVTHFL